MIGGEARANGILELEADLLWRCLLHRLRF